MSLGPTLADGEHLWFDGACSVQVVAVDLEAEERGLELVRRWGREGWTWVEQPVADTGAIEVLRDAAGDYIGRALGETRLQRTASRPAMNTKGQVVGTEDRWATATGDVATLRWEGGSLVQVSGPSGQTTYSYVAGALTRIQTGDGGVVNLAPGLIQTPAATWRCQVEGAGTNIEVGGSRWRVEGSREGGKQRVTDPAGGVTETRWDRGALTGWTDPGGGVTRVERSAGRVTLLSSAAGSWSFAWSGTGEQPQLTGLNGGGSWSLAYDAAGNVKALTDPLGRLATWSFGGDGLVRSWGRGSPKRVWERDSSGRVTGLGEGGRVGLRRDSAGRIVGVGDGAGGEWRLVRSVDGRISEVSDPGGARWLLTWDAVGRLVELSDPVGRITRVSRTAAGIATVTIEGQSWQFGRDSEGRATSAEDPWGRRWTISRDALGRAVAVGRPDQTTIRIPRDALGNIVGVQDSGNAYGNDFAITRDAAGHPVAWSRGRASGAWTWEGDRLSGVRGPGVQFEVQRDAAGQITGVELGSGERWTLARDEAGRVLRVDGVGAVTLGRDTAGRVVSLLGPAGDVRVERDGRGLVSRVRAQDRSWGFRRDAAGRLTSVEAPEDVRLGVDRDAAGRPLLARFSDGSLARYVWDRSGVAVMLQDADGVLTAVTGWTLDGLGRITRLRGEEPVLLQRDPLGALIVQEGAEVWSRGADRVEGPGEASLTWDREGRPAQAQMPPGAPPAWGVADGRVDWVTDVEGALSQISGGRGTVTLAHDALGRLTGWTAPTLRAGATAMTIARDALGRLVSVGPTGGVRREALGWEGLLALAGSPRASVADIGQGRPGGGVLVDARRTPLLVAPLGRVAVAPSGLPLTAATGEVGAAGRFQPVAGGPLVGLLDAIDPVSGQSTSAPWPMPGVARGWEVRSSESPWPEPDAHANPVWDPHPFAAEAPWGDPLALLVEVGELPNGGPRTEAAPGLPWMPLSLSPSVPAPIPDPDAVDLRLGAIEAWVLARARSPVNPAEASDLATAALCDYGAQLGGSLGSGMDTVTSCVLLSVLDSRN